FIRRTAWATRSGSSSSSANGFAVVTAQNPHARVQRSPAIMKVAVPWLQHSQRFGHCALSQTVCSRKSEMSALVEKKTGFDGNRTLIQGGFCAWCRAGSIFAQDISSKVTTLKALQKLNRCIRIPEFYPQAPPLPWGMKVEAVGENKYAITFSPDAVDTIVADGTDQPALSGTTLSIT